jgi:hypothetical protein
LQASRFRNPAAAGPADAGWGTARGKQLRPAKANAFHLRE